ncbi:MAG TPA: hypothetical protein VHO47_02975 [Candidatus Babeliales bacterium]|nr:hypothetical protein [Candidatus Babeliales bacterium]
MSSPLSLTMQLIIVLLFYFFIRAAISFHQTSLQNKVLANKTEFTVDEYQDLLIDMFGRIQKSKESFGDIENIEGTVDDDRAVFIWIEDRNWHTQRWLISRDLSRKLIIVERTSEIEPRWTRQDLVTLTLVAIALCMLNALISLHQ